MGFRKQILSPKGLWIMIPEREREKMSENKEFDFENSQRFWKVFFFKSLIDLGTSENNPFRSLAKIKVGLYANSILKLQVNILLKPDVS